jgi:hypothetical protein
MHFSFNLLRIKGPLQVSSITCSSLGGAPTNSIRYIACVQYQLAVAWLRWNCTSWGWASNARNLQRLLILNTLNEKCITLVSLHWWHVHINMEVANNTETCVVLLYKSYEPTAPQMYKEWNSFTGWCRIPQHLLTTTAVSDTRGSEALSGTLRKCSS